MMERVGQIPVLLFVFVLAGCTGKPDGPEATAAAGIEKTFERGPFQVILRLDKKDPTIADRIRLEIFVTADEDYEVTLPTFGEQLNQFGIVDYTKGQPELTTEGRTRQRQAYVLEPFLSGDYTIPPMTFGFRKEGEPDHQLETEEIKLTVSSLLPEVAAETLQIHAITDPVQVERPSRAGLWWILLAPVIAGGAAYFWWKHRRPPSEPVPVARPAHEIAFDELEQLISEGLTDKGEIKAFYQRISDILRRYIENRFGVHAPGQTTEEFLVNQGMSHLFEPGHQDLLKTFLQHCDLVKFAEHQPTTEDIQGTFDACKEFILQTQLPDEPQQKLTNAA